MSSRPTVLVVDDEAGLREEICDFLSWNGMDVLAAESAEAALTTLAANPAVTVILTDIRMPHTSGLVLVEQVLQARSEANMVEAVLMTGHGRLDDAVAAVRSGAFDLLQKPMSLTDVLAVVGKAHARAMSRRETEAARVAELEAVRADYAALQARLLRPGSAIDLQRDSPPEVARILLHQLRSPLTPLVALPDLLRDSQDLAPGRLNELLELVQSSGLRLVEIADDLVELLDRQPLSPAQLRPVAVHTLVESLLATHASAANTAGVALVIGEVAEGTVSTDPTVLLRTLGRLVRNAIAACGAGGLVTVSARAAPDGCVSFRVEDTGAGMTEAELAAAHLPFQKSDIAPRPGSTARYPSLALASRAAERLGGQLQMASAAGQGTVAAILLPRHHADHRPSP